MSVSADFLAYVVDQFTGFSRIRSRRMFGSVGLYANDLFFGLIADDTLYFKVGDSNRARYTARGCEPFRPFAADPDGYSLSYYRVPVEVLEDPDELHAWARQATAVAAAKAQRPKRKQPSRTAKRKR